MCPAGYRFYRDGMLRRLIDRTTVAPNEVLTVGPNPERVGFVLATGGGVMQFRPTTFGVNVIAGSYNPGGFTQPQDLTIERYGQLILLGWDFILQNAGNSYQVWEIRTPKDFQ